MPRESLLRHLQNALIGRATGSLEELVVDNRPRSVLFAGCLLPRPDAKADALESAEDFFARLAPSAIQLRFLVEGASSIINIQPKLHIYFRVAPPFEAQLKRSARAADGTALADRLVKAFRKLPAKLPALREPIGRQGLRRHSLGATLTDQVAIGVAADSDSLRLLKDWKVSAEALRSDTAFRSWCGTGSAPRAPNFAVDVDITSSPTSDPTRMLVCVSLVNRSVPDADLERQEYWDQAIFDAKLEVHIESGKILPFTLADLPNSYRFDRHQWGIGINCVAEVDSERTVISSNCVPTYNQPTLVHRTLPDVDLAFETLAETPFEPLQAVWGAMAVFRDGPWGVVGKELADQGHLDDDIAGDYQQDLKEYETEMGEFAAGIALLQDARREPLLRAFTLANRALAGLHRGGSWRLFQLVFVVRNLVTLAAREWADVDVNDEVEVLWFPTGGGKTEAFLGLTLTAMFFDRIRGRERGTTAVLRLPLRLLSLQQFQRIVRAVAAADVVRAETVGGKPFSVGYWIGRGGSPNKVEPQEAELWQRDPGTCQKYRRVRECPYCGAPVRMRFDPRLWALLHHCSSDKCGRDGDLPLFVVDDELYRFLPSIVVGTVDKLAAFGFQQRFCNLLGWPGGYCRQHGFTARDECLVPKCKEAILPAKLKDPVPSLHIQDELHLLKEDLGAFDGHYETAMQRVQEWVPGGRPWKTIAATATIERYDWHVRHLYCKKARRFPAPGPRWAETFYTKSEDRVSRVFLGLLPFNRSHINSMISVLASHHCEVRTLQEELRSQPGAALARLRLPAATPTSEIVAALRDYEISLSYVLTRKAGDQMAESLSTQVAGYLRDEGLEPLQVRSLTGQSTASEIEDTLGAVDRSARRGLDEVPEVEAITATSMISHGVDVDRFNFIAFFGMPRMTAEYIQASSRVARRHPGLVIVVFSPARERDRSHYHLFGKYHEYLDRLVEPAAINRWARFAVRHTVPGLLVGYVINVLGRRFPTRKLYMENQLHRALYADRVITVDELVEAVVSMYGLSEDDSPYVRQDIRSNVELRLNGIRRNAQRVIWKTIPPMMSLRDVEEPIYFTPSNYSSRAFELWMKRRRRGGGELGVQGGE